MISLRVRCVTGTAPPGESEDEPEVSDILDTGGEVLVSSNTVDGAVGSWHDGDLLQSFFTTALKRCRQSGL